jgi:hypothetical protein
VDTVVIEHDDRYVVDGRRLLRRVMSYRIADVPKYVLARSVFESLGDFATDAIRPCAQVGRPPGASLAIGRTPGRRMARSRPVSQTIMPPPLRRLFS